MTYKIVITNLKTNGRRTFYSVGRYPNIGRLVDRVEDETPIRDLPRNRDQYKIIVATQ